MIPLIVYDGLLLKEFLKRLQFGNGRAVPEIISGGGWLKTKVYVQARTQLHGMGQQKVNNKLTVYDSK